MSPDEPTDSDIIEVLSALTPDALARGLAALDSKVPVDDWDRNFLAATCGLPGFLHSEMQSHPRWAEDLESSQFNDEVLDIVAELSPLGKGAFLVQWLAMQQPERLSELAARCLSMKTGRPVAWKTVPPNPPPSAEPSVARVQAAQLLRDRLSPERMLKIFEALKLTPRETWLAENHMGLGIAVRNTLRSAGFNESSLGVESLDTAWGDILWDAVTKSESELAITPPGDATAPQETTGQPDSARRTSEQRFVESMLERWLDEVQHSPNDVELLMAIASAYGKLHQYTSAATFFTRAVAVNPRSPDALMGLAAAYGHLDLAELKVETCLRVLSIDPRRADAYAKMGSALCTLDRYGDAIRAFESAGALGADDADLHLGLGLAYAATGRLTESSTQLSILQDRGAWQASELQKILTALGPRP
jgi:hypothetical protein